MDTVFEIAIVGAGPGGLAAASNSASQGIEHLLFESLEIGNTVFDYQLKKLVMAEPRKLPLGGLVKFEEGSREEVLANFNACIKEHKVNLVKSRVLEIVKNDAFLLSRQRIKNIGLRI